MWWSAATVGQGTGRQALGHGHTLCYVREQGLLGVPNKRIGQQCAANDKDAHGLEVGLRRCIR